MATISRTFILMIISDLGQKIKYSSRNSLRAESSSIDSDWLEQDNNFIFYQAKDSWKLEWLLEKKMHTVCSADQMAQN